MRLEEGILSNLRMPFLYPIFIKVCLLIFFFLIIMGVRVRGDKKPLNL